MNNSSKKLIETLRGNHTGRPPFWFMRQAGRYLPEYRGLRAKSRNFLEFCYTPEMAVEATLQPIRRFGMDAAILFSDILVVPHAIGVEVAFEEGEGPRLAPVAGEAGLDALSLGAIEEKLAPVYAAIGMLKDELPKDVALIGFAGAPWTLACYMVEGKGTKTFERARKAASEESAFFEKLILLLSEAVIRHLDLQIKAGAEAVQLFDSWAGLLDGEEYRKWVVEPAKRIVSEMKKRHPHIPIIAFPRQSGGKFLNYVKETKAGAVSIDGSVPMDWARENLQPLTIVQGALNQELLADDREAMFREAETILHALGDKPFVFNLAHGILPRTPVENVAALCEYLKYRAA